MFQQSFSKYDLTIVESTQDDDEEIRVVIDEDDLNELIGVYLENGSSISSRNSGTIGTRGPDCDVFVTDLQNLSVGPYKINVPYSFKFTYGNYGPDTAASVILEVKLDNDVAGYITVGNLSAYTGWTTTIALTVGYNSRGGNRALSITAYTTTNDTNLNNNKVSKTYEWYKNVDLENIDLKNHTSGNNDFEATIPQLYSVIVANFGLDTATAPNTTFEVFREDYYGSTPVNSGKVNLPQLPSGYYCVVTSTQYINRSGYHRFLVTSKDAGNKDYNVYTDNITTAYWTCIPDGCGLWGRTLTGSTTNISFGINHDWISTSDVIITALQWNGISSNINVPTSNITRNNLYATCGFIVYPLQGNLDSWLF
jgi:hypothetical protein